MPKRAIKQDQRTGSHLTVHVAQKLKLITLQLGHCFRQAPSEETAGEEGGLTFQLCPEGYYRARKCALMAP